MMEGKTRGTHKLYRGHNVITFWDCEVDEVYAFNNVREILEYQKMPVNATNINLLNVNINRALKRDNKECRFLNGRKMKLKILKIDRIE